MRAAAALVLALATLVGCKSKQEAPAKEEPRPVEPAAKPAPPEPTPVAPPADAAQAAADDASIDAAAADARAMTADDVKNAVKQPGIKKLEPVKGAPKR